MVYQFDGQMAEKYGVNEAVFAQNIFFWVCFNEANKKHFYEGRYWTYNTKSAFTKLFPFWTYDQIRTIIKKLVEKEVLITGNFNENTWDKTAWYSLSDEVMEFFKNNGNASKNALGKNPQSIRVMSPIEVVESPNRLGNSTLSYIGTDNKPYSKPDYLQKIDFSENSVFLFFLENSPSRFEIKIMQLKSKIKDFQRFVSNFECVFIEEKKDFDVNIIEARLQRFANNWNDSNDSRVIPINNQQTNNEPAYRDVRF